MNDFAVALVACVVCLVFGVVVGHGVTNEKWKTDCEQLGATYAGPNVYTCAKKARTP